MNAQQGYAVSSLEHSVLPFSVLVPMTKEYFTFNAHKNKKLKFCCSLSAYIDLPHDKRSFKNKDPEKHRILCNNRALDCFGYPNLGWSLWHLK